MILMTGACGAGKTQKAVRLTQDVVSQGGRVLYIAPTRALSEQFAKMVENLQIKVARAYGRKMGENCENPNLDIAIALGEGFGPICESCSFRAKCRYIAGTRELTDWTSNVVVTTYHFVAWSLPESYPRPNLVILDDVNDPILLSPSNMPPKPTALVSILAGPRKNRQYYFLPRVPVGEENLVISATPPRTLLQYQVGDAEIREESADNSPPLDQTVVVHLAHCTHTSPWLPPPGTCGFKKNTSPDLPYFRASTGLNDWRGIGLRVAGSFSPPMQTYAIVAAILSILSGEQYRVVFLPAVMEFENGKKIRTAIFGIKNHRLAIDVSAMASIYPLVQLLGRSGKGTQTTYYGDIPLNFVCDNERIRFASRVILASAPPEVVKFHSTRFRVAEYLSGELSIKKLSTEERRYLGFVNSILSQANQEIEKWVAQKTSAAREQNGQSKQ